MAYQDVMVGKVCKNAQDFVRLISAKNTSIIVHEIVANDIENMEKKLSSLFLETQPIPEIQKLHSMTAIDVDKVECRVYSYSLQKTVVCF